MLAFWMSRFSKEVLGGILIVRRSTHGWFVVAVGGFIILMNLSFNKVHFHHRRFLGYKTHTIYLWYIYLHECLIFRVDVGIYIYMPYMDAMGKSPTLSAQSVPQVYPTSKTSETPKTGGCFSRKFCGAPTFPGYKKNARHVVSTWQSLTPIRPPDAWKLLKSLQGTRCIRKWQIWSLSACGPRGL